MIESNFDFTSRFFSYLRAHMDEFPSEPYFKNLYSAVKYAVKETGHFNEKFSFGGGLGVWSSEVSAMIGIGNDSLLLEPCLDKMAYRFPISENTALEILRITGRDEKLKELVDKVVEYFVKVPEIKRKFEEELDRATIVEERGLLGGL
jgi:hypothetical protein